MSDKKQPNADVQAMVLSTTTRPAMRLYEDDNTRIVDLHKQIGPMTGKSQTDIVRDCIHAGLPVIEKQWAPMIGKK